MVDEVVIRATEEKKPLSFMRMETFYIFVRLLLVQQETIQFGKSKSSMEWLSPGQTGMTIMIIWQRI